MYIYFIQEQNMGYIKIGSSKNPFIRAYSLQTASPGKLKIIGIIKGVTKQEKELHRQFESYRFNGEWFKPAINLLNSMQSLLDNNPINEDMPVLIHGFIEYYAKILKRKLFHEKSVRYAVKTVNSCNSEDELGDKVFSYMNELNNDDRLWESCLHSAANYLFNLVSPTLIIKE